MKRTAILLWLAALAAPQDQPIKVTTRLVEVSVVALDGKGHPIEGLTKDDFVLSDKGKPQAISKFSMDVRKAPVARKPLPAGLFTNAPEFAPRPTEKSVTILLFDALNTPQADQIYARREMVKFLGTLRPGDQVALYTLGRDLRIVHEFSDDVLSLVKTAQKLQSMSPMELDQGISTDGIDNEELAGFINDANRTMTDFYTINRVQSTLAAMEGIATHVRSVPGRKNLVWMSGSFPVWIGLDDEVMDANGKMFTGERRNFAEDIERTVRLINASNIAIYPVDSRGLMTDPSVGASISRPINVRQIQPAAKDPMQAINLTHSSMSMLAERTGGRAFYNGNDLARAIRTAIDESRVTYLLGYYPNHGQWDGKWHEIKLKTSRPGVHLRYRTGYAALADGPRTPREHAKDIETALRSPNPETGLILGSYVSRKTGSPGALNVRLQVSAQEVTMTLANGKWSGVLEIYYLLLKALPEKNEMVSKSLNMNLTKDQYTKFMKEGMVVDVQFALPKKLERLRIVVSDKPSGALGSLSIDPHGIPEI